MDSSLRTTDRRRKVAGTIIASLLVGGIAPVTFIASRADALSATCADWKTTVQHRFRIDDNYANTKCSVIGINTEVRSRLDVTGDSDKVSVWFTRTNFTYSTPTMSCWWGCRATHETARHS
jgi:hypothetical protein